MRSSTIAARCAALNTSIAQASFLVHSPQSIPLTKRPQVIPDISSFARRLRDARSDLNTINNDLLVIRTGLGVAQDDFSTFGSTLPTSLVEAFSQILDSSDDTSERLHKCFLKLSCGSAPKSDWLTLKNGPLVNLRQDLEASRIVLDLAIDYLSLFGKTDTLDALIDDYVGELTASTDDLLKRTDMEEIHVNQIARDRLSSLLQAIRLLRSCITAISKEGAVTGLKPVRRTTTPRPDSLEPALGETRRSASNASQPSQASTTDKSIGAWLADVPCHQDARPLTHSMIIKVTGERRIPRPPSNHGHADSHGTFYTDDGVSTNRTLVAPESRLRKSRSWCSEASTRLDVKMRAARKSRMTQNSSTMSSSDVSVFHRNLTSDKIAVAKGRRKDLDIDSRVGVDRILSNVPSDVTAGEVERILWEGANPMVAHPEFGYFYIRAAYEMAPDVLKVLMEYGADITRTVPAPNRYYSVMHAATLGRRLRTVNYLAATGHSIDCANSEGETPLHLAARTPGASDVAKYLADKGADVNHEANDGNTPLQRALTSTKLEGRERSEMIELLLAHGADGTVNQDLEGRRSNSKGLSILGIT